VAALRIKLAYFMQALLPETGSTFMQADLLIVWVAMLGAVSFLAFSAAD
jgi:hypothetical protein